ncbi:MAG: hypothetical protein QXI12_05185 [Candidatus Methanomethyliaceae archaeon]
MPSSGAVVIPNPLQPFWILGKCEFLHDTATYFLPPNFDLTFRWGPKENDKVFLIFSVTFGPLRDLVTGDIIESDEIGFWHRGMGMKLHWDPFVPSISGIVYPHVTPATKENPFEIRFVNKSNIMAYTDVSVWYFEINNGEFEKLKKACTSKCE